MQWGENGGMKGESWKRSQDKSAEWNNNATESRNGEWSQERSRVKN